MFCCLTASTARALLCIADAEFGIQVISEADVARPELASFEVRQYTWKVAGEKYTDVNSVYIYIAVSSIDFQT